MRGIRGTGSNSQVTAATALLGRHAVLIGSVPGAWGIGWSRRTTRSHLVRGDRGDVHSQLRSSLVGRGDSSFKCSASAHMGGTASLCNSRVELVSTLGLGQCVRLDLGLLVWKGWSAEMRIMAAHFRGGWGLLLLRAFGHSVQHFFLYLARLLYHTT